MERRASDEDEARARKARTEAWLTGHGLPLLATLPTIEAANEARLRAPRDVAWRARILLGVAAAGYHDAGIVVRSSAEEIATSLRAEGGWEYATPAEREFFVGPRSEQAVTDATWATEAIWPLLWALGQVEGDELDLPTTDVKPSALMRRMPGLSDSPAKWIAEQTTLRSIPAILDEADRAYRLHWAVRHWRGTKKCPLLPSAVLERHRALNWLIGVDDLDWDDVTTDT